MGSGQSEVPITNSREMGWEWEGIFLYTEAEHRRWEKSEEGHLSRKGEARVAWVER